MATKIPGALVLLCVLSTCSSSSSSSSSGSCGGFSARSNLSVISTLVEGFTSLCPASVSLDAASGSDASDVTTGDASPGDCTPVVSGCVLILSCAYAVPASETFDAGPPTMTISAHVTATGNSLSGTETITVPVAGQTSQTCTYN